MNTHESLVLVVEDEPLVRELVCELILELGHGVIAVDRGDKAVDYLEENALDVALVISDLRMPGGLDGCQLATLIALRWPGLPVLLSSGFSDAQLHHLPPHTSFIGKPWNFEQMEAAIGQYLPAPGIH